MNNKKIKDDKYIVSKDTYLKLKIAHLKRDKKKNTHHLFDGGRK
jgi:hypothetical protein